MNEDLIWTASGEGFKARHMVIYDAAPEPAIKPVLYRVNDDGTMHRFVGWGWRPA